MTLSRSNAWLGATLVAAVAAPLMLGAPAASARVDVGIGIGIPPLVVAPAPVYAAPPVVYAQPPVVYAQPPVVYGAPGVAVGGFWVTDRFGHRHWRRR